MNIVKNKTMKKQIILIATSFILWTSAALAAPSQVPETVLSQFNSEYAKAENIQWEETTDYFKVNFTLNDEYLFAYYSNSGEKMGVARYILSGQLPISLQKDIWDKFDNYWLTDLFELSNQEGSYYYVTLESADQILMLKGDGNGWSVYKKTDKS